MLPYDYRKQEHMFLCVFLLNSILFVFKQIDDSLPQKYLHKKL